MLALKDRRFQVKSATFFGILTNQFQTSDKWELDWYFDIETESAEFDNEWWQPHLEADSLRLEIPDLRKLAGRRFSVPEAYDWEREIHLTHLYVFEHEAVWASTIEVRSQVGDAIDVLWNARCDIGWDEPYATDVPLVVEAKFQFTGIDVFATTAEEAVQRLSVYYPPGDFAAERSHAGFNFRLRV